MSPTRKPGKTEILIQLNPIIITDQNYLEIVLKQ